MLYLLSRLTVSALVLVHHEHGGAEDDDQSEAGGVHEQQHRHQGQGGGLAPPLRLGPMGTDHGSAPGRLIRHFIFTFQVQNNYVLKHLCVWFTPF